MVVLLFIKLIPAQQVLQHILQANY